MLKRIWTSIIRSRYIKSKCNRSSIYKGKRCCIRKVGYLDSPMWHVAIYDCPDISQAVKIFHNLGKAVNRFIEVENGGLKGEIYGCADRRRSN